MSRGFAIVLFSLLTIACASPTPTPPPSPSPAPDLPTLPLEASISGVPGNSTPVVLVLIDHETALFATPVGARILLARHDGPRAYRLCA